MTLTGGYTALHVALRAALQTHGLEVPPSVARVLLALHERGGSATSFELVGDLQLAGSAVRRALADAYAHGLASGLGVDGQRRRNGVVTQVTLEPAGRVVVRSILGHHHILSSPLDELAEAA